MNPKELDDLCLQIQQLQRARVVCLKSRIMLSNRLQAVVAGTIGYHSGMGDKEREKMMREATKRIKDVAKGNIHSDFDTVISVHQNSVDILNEQVKQYEQVMLESAKQLPIATWVTQQEQRGFGLLFAAIVIGETGNLSNYANPAKVWRRLGCAPYSKGGKTAMGATWRGGREGKLTAEDWTDFGYSPRRRSISYLIGENIVKLNAEGPYRERYNQVKREAAEKHPEWVICQKCGGKKKTAKGTKCSNCRGTGKVAMRVHRHAMLLATKLLLKNLWIEWNK